MQTIQDKEQIIVGTIINCNKEIHKFLNESKSRSNGKLTNFFESISYNSDVYHYNMVNLYSTITNVDLLESNSMEFPTMIENKRNNYYSYFQKVYSFLNGFELNIQKSLNENLTVDDTRVKNPIQINITSFKTDLKKIIETLVNQNDLNNYSSDILKIKTFAKQPLFINGYNICGNIGLMQELQITFGILYQNLMAICFNQVTKQLYFVTNNTNKLIVYSIENDSLDYYNKVNQPIPSVDLKGGTYLETIKTLTGINAIIELYVNVVVLNLKFSDNLYHDTAYVNFRLKLNAQNTIVK